MKITIFNDRGEEYANLELTTPIRPHRENDYFLDNVWTDDDGDVCTLGEVLLDAESDLA